MSGIKKSIIISKEIWIAFMSMFLLVQGKIIRRQVKVKNNNLIYLTFIGNNLNCQMDHSNCILSNDVNQTNNFVH